MIKYCDTENCKNCDNWMCGIDSEEEKEEMCLYPEMDYCYNHCEQYWTPKCCYYYDPESGECSYGA